MDNLVNNYYVLRQFISAIHPDVIHSTIVDCYSHSKNEYVFQVRTKGEVLALSIYFAPTDVLIQYSSRSKPKSGTKQVFRSISGKDIIDSGMFENDRSFYFLLSDDFRLVFKMYGGHGNVILYKGTEVVELSRPQFQKDQHKDFDSYHNAKNQSIETYRQALAETGDPLGATKRMFPTFSASLMAWLRREGLEEQETNTQWETIQRLLQYLDHPEYFINRYQTGKKNDPGLVLSVFEGEEVVLQTTDVIEALNQYARQFLRDFHFLQRKNSLLDRLKNQRQKLHKNLKNVENRLYKLQNEVNYQQVADLIMANLHQIDRGVDSVQLQNFYTGGLTNVSLRKNLTPQKNAERYYRKAKNQGIEIENLENRIQSAKGELQKIKQQVIEVEQEDSFKKIKARHKDTFKNKEGEEQDEKFRSLSYKGYRIYIGKSARNNDELTLHFASGKDMWLHARDQHGSHVIIRNKGQETYPEPVIEKAAELAAYYSKGKSEEFCPVAYTLCKYVRKPKGSHPGAVVYQNEKVMLAKPASALKDTGA